MPFKRVDETNTIEFSMFGKESYKLDIEKRNMRKQITEMVTILNVMEKMSDGFMEWYKSILFGIHQIKLDNETNEITKSDEEQIKAYAYSLAESFTSNKNVNENIVKFIDTKYTVDMDKVSANAKIRNEELQFLDVHAKSVLCGTAMIRMVIPIISAFASTFSIHNDKKKLNYDMVFNIVFIKILETFQGDACIINKITKLVESRVRTSIYSNRVIWTFLENVGKTPETVISDIRRSLICEIIPKLSYDRSVISMFTVVITKQLDFQFTENFSLTYKPIAVTNNDSDEAPTDFVKIFSRDEGINAITELDVAASVNTILDRLNCDYLNDPNFEPIKINMYEEVFYASPYFTINEFQKFVVFTILSSFTAIPYRAFNNLSRVQYARALILSYHILKRNSLPSMAKLLISVPIIPKRKRLNKQLLGNIFGCNLYDAIIDKNFKIVGKRLRDQSVIINKIMQVDTQFKMIPLINLTHIRDFILVRDSVDAIPPGYKINRRDIVQCSEHIIEECVPKPIPKQLSTEFLVFLNKF